MRCVLALLGLLVLSVVSSGCGGDTGEAQKPVQEVAAPNPDSDFGPNSDSLSIEIEEEDLGPEKNPVARPSLLMEYMAQPLREAMEPGGGEPAEEEVEVDTVEVEEETTEESPKEEEAPSDDEPAEDAPADDEPKSDAPSDEASDEPSADAPEEDSSDAGEETDAGADNGESAEEKSDE